MLCNLPVIKSSEDKIKILLKNIDTLLYAEIDLYSLCIKNFFEKKNSA